MLKQVSHVLHTVHQHNATTIVHVLHTVHKHNATTSVHVLHTIYQHNATTSVHVSSAGVVHLLCAVGSEQDLHTAGAQVVGRHSAGHLREEGGVGDHAGVQGQDYGTFSSMF